MPIFIGRFVPLFGLLIGVLLVTGCETLRVVPTSLKLHATTDKSESETDADSVLDAGDENEFDVNSDEWRTALRLRLMHGNWRAIADDEFAEAFTERRDSKTVFRWHLAKLDLDRMEQTLTESAAKNLKNANADGAIDSAARVQTKLETDHRLKLLDSADTILAHTGADERAKVDQHLKVIAQRSDKAGINAKILLVQRRVNRSKSDADDLKAMLSLKPPKIFRDDEIQRSVQNEESIVRKVTGLLTKTANSKVLPHKTKQTVRTDRMPLPTQGAAAEAWCELLRQTHSNPAIALRDAGELLDDITLSDHIRAELYRALAVDLPPVQIPHLNAAVQYFVEGARPRQSSMGTKPINSGAYGVKGPEAAVVSAALEACRLHAISRYRESKLEDSADQSEVSLVTQRRPFDAQLWPVSLKQLSLSPSKAYRRLFADWITYSGHPEASRYLKLLSTDEDPHVRLLAIQRLGVVGDAEAIEALHAFSDAAQEQVRLAAMTGFALHDFEQARQIFADDESHRIRSGLAAYAAKDQTRETARTLWTYAEDRNTDVQLAAISAVQDWPDRLAFPVLVKAFEDGTMTARHQAFLGMQRRRSELPAPRDFHSRSTRRQLVMVWAHRHNVPTTFESDRVGAGGFSQQAFEVAQARLIRALADWKDSPPGIARELHTSELRAMISREHLAMVATFIKELDAAARNALLTDVLSETLPEFAALELLDDDDILVRRRAASELATLSTEFSLSPLLVHELLAPLQYEQDNLIWRQVMQAIGKDVTDANIQIAALALRNNWPDIQVLGCEYLGQHRLTQQAHLLVPLFDSKQAVVQIASIKAAGRCRNPVVIRSRGNRRGLIEFLHEQRSDLRLAAVVSLAQLNQPVALQELSRLSHDERPGVRQMVAQAYGETGDARYITSLIQMARVENKHDVLTEIQDSLLGLVPESDQPATLLKTDSVKDKRKKWIEWYDSRAERNSNNGSSRL